MHLLFKGKMDDNDIADDFTEDMITYLKTVGKKLSAMELARACGTSTSGKSMSVTVSLLGSHIQEVNDCTNLFEKLAKRSGGLMIGTCTHGIVHCMKFMVNI